GVAWLPFLRDAVAIVLATELLVYCSLLFHVETKWGTLPTLLMLPTSVPRIGYLKLIGCLLASLPTALVLAILLAIPEDRASLTSGLGLWGSVAQPVISLCVLLILC